MEKSIYTEQYGLMVDALRKARESAGLSQVELATKLGLTQSTVGKCERGERRLDIIELREWCLALGVTLSSFSNDLEVAIARLAQIKLSARNTPRKRSQ
ncbi:XRE family transcriptional regulator [Paraburkholderia silviterrae]|uniref:XRE family transcriptional regulator n=1 Tax=Paraburkholderia silviterrae TaxID=2528715 RepID=A0A4R5MCQ3_9BURK|nr:XRE family transcriptional regulator [Paraburkholderia silviterrae]